MADRPDRVAQGVLEALGMWRVPVDPFAIAKEEGIELATGRYGHAFDARIEYSAEIDTFILYYREPGPGRPLGRVRFSLAHELGHFYLPHHREALLRGRAHNSVADFRSKDPLEREADEFAAALLMPGPLFVAAVHRLRGGFCVLSDLGKLAEEVFGTSITSTALRYCEHDLEPCAVIVSEGEKVKWTARSESMARLGMGFVPFGDRVPAPSVTARLWRHLRSGQEAEPVEGPVDAAAWYDRPGRERLWEEAMPLGQSGLVLTYLIPEDADED